MPNYEEMRQPIYDAINARYCEYAFEHRLDAAREVYTLTKVYALTQSFTKEDFKQAALFILKRAFRFTKDSAHAEAATRLHDIYEMWKGGIYHVGD